MKPANSHIGRSIHQFSNIILLGTVVAAMTTVACSHNSNPSAKAAEPVKASLRPAALESVAPIASERAMSADVSKSTDTVKQTLSKIVTYKSRDYGVSFNYPRPYAYWSAKAIANGDASLKPKTDGHDGQFTMARIDIPKGFYPETDFESGYFTLSLNQDLSAEDCEALVPNTEGKSQTVSLNGTDFRWMESEEAGGGASSKVRNYVNYSNGVCYELEMGVKTRNESGLAREVDPDQVLRRLDGILQTVKIAPNGKKTVVQESAQVADEDSKN